MANRKIQGEITLDSRQAEESIARVETSTKRMAQTASQEGKKTEQAISSIGNSSGEVAQKVDRSTSNIISSIQRATAARERDNAAIEAGGKGTARYYELLAQRQGISIEALRPHLAQLEAANKQYQLATGGLQQMGGAASQAQKHLQGMGSSFVDITKTIALMSVGLAGIGSLAALRAGIFNAIEGMAGLKDAAERTGASVEKLSALKSVAKIGGRDFAEIEGAIVKLNKALHSTDDESKGAGKALAAIGLNIEELRAKDPAAAVFDIAKAFDKFQDGSGKSAAAMAIFGKTGAQLLPFLKDLAEQGELVGKVTAEQARQADEYEKAMRRLSGSFSATSKAIAIELLPWLNQAAQSFLIARQHSDGFFDTLTKKIPGLQLVNVEAELAKVRAEFEQVDFRLSNNRARPGDDKLFAKLQKELDYYQALLAAQNKLADPPKSKALDTMNFGPTGAEPKGVADKITEAQRLLQTLSQQIAIRELDIQTAGKQSEAESEVAKVMTQLRDDTLKTTEAERIAIAAKAEKLLVIDRELIAQREYEKALEGANKAMADSRAEMEKAIQKAQEQADLWGLSEAQISVVKQARLADALAIAEENGASEDQLAYLREELRLRGQLTDALIDVERKKLAMGKSGLTDLDDYAKNAARDIQRSFADFLFDPFAKGVDGMAIAFGNVIKRMVAEAVAADLARKLFGSLVQGGNGPGLLGDMFSLLGGAFAGGSATAGLSAASTGAYMADLGSWGMALIDVMHTGGMVGQYGLEQRAVPMQIFAGAQRFHSGGWPGLKSDEVPIIAQRGERMLSRDEVAATQNRSGITSRAISITVNVESGAPNEVRRAGGAVAREVARAVQSAHRYS